MLNYDFKILHSNEFECFTRDLLQASEHLRIESFAEGRDGGIDLRFAYDSTKKCIVQCKRYKYWNELKNTLKKEVEKVKRLNPDRYILSTSVDLTAKNKDEIKEIFTPYIKDTAKDILGQSDLNNLLGQHPGIEKQYYQLWLGSTNVLETIVHKDIDNWSKIELKIIESEKSKYVFNDSFVKAQEILQKYKYIIISGIPGIGKTTLARMLVHHYLSNGFEEFIYVIDDLNNACKKLKENKKQVFFFDDFLGSNFFENQIGSFKNKLISFINVVKYSKNTLFIMTTREYILSDAKIHYGQKNLDDIEIAKCTIDLLDYSMFVKAKILCNHLKNAHIPKVFIDALIENKNYLHIINHRNFNPRIIETFTKKQIWNSIEPTLFVKSLLDFFEKPFSIWEDVFENENFGNYSRYALLVLISIGNYVYEEEWQNAFKYFCKQTYDDTQLGYDDVKWKLTLKKLQNCFIKIERDDSGINIVKPFNASIIDFCVSYLKANKDTLLRLLQSVMYPEQLTSIFTSDNIGHRKINIGENLYPSLHNILQKVWNTIEDKRRKLFFYYQFSILFKSFCKTYPLEELLDKDIIDELSNPLIDGSLRFKIMQIINWKKISTKPKDILIDIGSNGLLDAFEWDSYVETVIKLGFASSILKNKQIHKNLQACMFVEIDKVDNFNNLERIWQIIDYFDYLTDKQHTNWDMSELLSYIHKNAELLRNQQDKDSNEGKDSLEIPTTDIEECNLHELFISLYNN